MENFDTQPIKGEESLEEIARREGQARVVAYNYLRSLQEEENWPGYPSSVPSTPIETIEPNPKYL